MKLYENNYHLRLSFSKSFMKNGKKCDGRSEDKVACNDFNCGTLKRQYNMDRGSRKQVTPCSTRKGPRLDMGQMNNNLANYRSIYGTENSLGDSWMRSRDCSRPEIALTLEMFDLNV